jgi:hypothetical protein
MIIVRILFHVLPLIPFALNMPSLGLAALLAVALAYIKVYKLDTQIAEASGNAGSLKRAQSFWAALTFLRR